jgi:hypothetical protein
MDERKVKNEYVELLRYLEYTLHELPTGVLYDANGADEKNCTELMKATYRLEELSKILGIDNSKFLEGCRWHYERYPHYLSRYRHFGSYEDYIEKFNGPEQVKA